MIKKTDYKFVLEDFEGPLDLLLHLIREKKMDLLQLSLIKVADQFIKFITGQENYNLDIASEYLLIASQLLDLKAKHMLKTELFIEKSDFEDSDQENLLERLIKYEKFKKLSENVKSIYDSSPRYEKIEDEFISFIDDETNQVINIISNGNDDLLKSWNNIMIRLRSLKPLETRLSIKKMSVDKRREEILQVLSAKKKITFFDIIDQNTNYYIAITLLVLLELVRDGIVNIFQTEEFDDIKIEKNH